MHTLKKMETKMTSVSRNYNKNQDKIISLCGATTMTVRLIGVRVSQTMVLF